MVLVVSIYPGQGLPSSEKIWGGGSVLPIPDKISAHNQLSVNLEDLESQFYSKQRSSLS